MGLTREEAKEFMWLENNKNPSVIKWQHHKTIRDLVEKLIDQIFSDHKTQLKAKDEEIRRLNNLYADTVKDLGDALIEIERLKEIINTSIEEIEYAIIKPQYVEVYLNNAIRFLKEQQ